MIYLESSNCECECNKSCDIGEYLDYSNCRCKKKLFDKLMTLIFIILAMNIRKKLLNVM